MLSSPTIIISDSSADVILDGTLTTDNLSISAGASAQIGGDITVNNDFTATGNSTLNFTGGTFTVNGNTNLRNSAEFNVDGGVILQLGDLRLNGSADIIGINTGGIIGYTTISFANSSTTIQCVSNTCLYSEASTMLPPNPLDLLTGAQFLPVSLINFDVKWQAGTVRLNWSTSEEYDNNFFLLEHSADGLLFSKLSTIDSYGSSNDIQHYTFIHSKPAVGNNYYRLTQFDVDGTESILGLRTIKHQSSTLDDLSIAPNPISRGQLFSLNLPAGDQAVTIYLLSRNGQRIALPYSKSNSELNLPADLAAGLYYLNVVSSSDSKMLPLVVIE